MKTTSILSYSLGTLVFLLLCFGYSQYVYFSGGPDGYMTDYEVAAKSLYLYFLIPGILLIIYSLYLARAVTDKPTYFRLIVVAVIGLILLGIFVTLENQYYNTMDHGQGG